jgi:hypothetical protein
VTLDALSHKNLNSIVEPYSAAITTDSSLGTAFVIYCNDIPTTALAQSSAAQALLDNISLGQISEITSQTTDRLGATSLMLAAYEQAAHLAMRFARPAAPEYNSLEKQSADIHEALWRLFLAAYDSRTDPVPGVAVDWMMLANHNPSSFEYSQWRF